MGDVSISINDSEFKAAIAEVQRDTGKTSVDIIKDVMRLWVDDLVKKTPDRKGQSHQRKVIQRDTSKVLAPIRVNEALVSWQKSFDEGKSEIWRRDSTGKSYKISSEDAGRKVVKDISIVGSYHNAHRNKRGRVSGVMKAESKEWYPGKILVPESVHKKYLRNVFRHIGKTKAGWIKGIMLFKCKMPAMISRNSAFGTGYSNAGNSLSESSMKGEVFAENSVPWIRNVDRMMDVTLSTRQKDLRSGKYLARWAKAMKAKSVSA